MQKLLMMAFLILNSAGLLAKAATYWQEYGVAPLVPFVNPVSNFVAPKVNNPNKLQLVLNCSDSLSVNSLTEFAKLLFKINEEHLVIYKAKAVEFNKITQPVGFTNAQEYNLNQIKELKRLHPQEELRLYMALTEFVALSPMPTIHQLVTVFFNEKSQDFVSTGIMVDHEFYLQHMQLPSRQQAYTMSYALEKVYKVSSQHWQLSVTNNKLTQSLQLKTALSFKS